jgi:hypothetical protein
MTSRARLLAIKDSLPHPEPKRDRAELTEGAARLASASCSALSTEQEAAIAALLTEATFARSAAAAGIDEGVLFRWLQQPSFRAAFRQARRELVEAGIGRIQAATGEAVETLVSVARWGRRDGDRIRAATALLDYALRGLTDADLVHGQTPAPGGAAPDGTADVVATLAARLQQVDRSELPAVEKARLTALLADSLLRAIGVDVLDKRLAAMHAVLAGRPESS